MNTPDKANYYNWLMKEHDKITELIRKVPKLSIEEQSRSVNLVEYSEENQKTISKYKTMLSKLENEATRITQYGL